MYNWCIGVRMLSWLNETILKLLNQKKFSLVSLVLHDFVDCEASEPDLVDFFVKHCSNLKKMEFENCWDSDFNYYSGPFVEILSRIGFKKRLKSK